MNSKRLKQGNNNIKIKLQNQGRHILANAVWRLLEMDLKTAFQKWNQYWKITQEKERVMSNLLQRLKVSYKQKIMTSWINWVKYPEIIELESKFDRKHKAKLQLIECKNLKNKKLSEESKLNYQKKQEVYDENSQYLSKSQSSFNSVRRQHTNFYSVSKLRWIIEEWKRITFSKKMGIKKLEKLINTQLIKKTIFLMNSVSETRKYVSQRQTILKKAVKNINLIK